MKTLSKNTLAYSWIRFAEAVLVVLTVSAEGFWAPCAADGLNPLLFPGSRYARENAADSALSHWASDINLQFVGMNQSPVKQEALGDFLALSTAAGVTATINGFPDNMFPSDTRVAASSNVLVIEYDEKVEYQLISGVSGSILDGIDLSSAPPQFSEYLKRALTSKAMAVWPGGARQVTIGLRASC